MDRDTWPSDKKANEPAYPTTLHRVDDMISTAQENYERAAKRADAARHDSQIASTEAAAAMALLEGLKQARAAVVENGAGAPTPATAYNEPKPY